jgi:hypothetical protein
MNAAFLTAAWLCLAQTPAGELDLTLKQVTARTVAATRAACDAVPSAKGKGRFSYRETVLRDGAIDTHYEVSSTFTFAFSGKRDFIKFDKSPTRDVDAQIYILDRNALLYSKFYPDHAHGYIMSIGHETGIVYEHGVPPHYLFQAWAEVEKPVKHAVSLEYDNGAYVIIKHGPPGLNTWKYFVDPAKDYHVVRCEKIRDERRAAVFEKNWARTSANVWIVCGHRHEDLPITEGEGGRVWEFEFDSFEPTRTIPEEVFTVDALGLPVGASITDQRKSPHVTTTVRPTETDGALIESIVGKLPTVGVPEGAAPPGASSRLR